MSAAPFVRVNIPCCVFLGKPAKMVSQILVSCPNFGLYLDGIRTHTTSYEASALPPSHHGWVLKKHLLTSECSTQHLLVNGNIQHVFFIPENSPVGNRHPLNYGKYCYNLFILPRHIYTTTWNQRLVEILVSTKLYCVSMIYFVISKIHLNFY